MWEAGFSPGMIAGYRVSDVLTRPLVSCSPEATVSAAAALMAAADTGSIVVLDDAGAPVGIMTDSDLRRRVVARELPLSTPVRAVMSSPVITVPPATLFFEAIGLMLEHRIHHLVVIERGRARGVIADSDLVAVLSSGPLWLERRINRATSVEELAQARMAFPEMLALLQRAGIRAYDLGRITAELTDRVVRRALEYAQAELGPAPVPFCWLALGSEGRREQTFHTDQDHGLVYADPAPEDSEESARYFLTLAERVVGILVRCGIPPCRGGAMASNPRWNRPLATWRAYFSDWIERPEPGALLDASIFFDLRPVAGELELGSALREHITSRAPIARRFLTLLALAVQEDRPPLGFFRHLVVEHTGEHRGELNIKRGGLLPIVNLARLYALRDAVPVTNTFERLRALSERGSLTDETATELANAYEFMLQLRLRAQLEQHARGVEPGNFIAPRRLTHSERVLLKEYFHTIALAQDEVQREFSTYLLA